MKIKVCLKRIQFKLSTSFCGERTFPEETNDSSMWSLRAQITQNPAVAPKNLQLP